MNKIITFGELQVTVTALHRENKKIVLVGGCFDILHKGHIEFLRLAKERGNILLVMLESDAAIKKMKGPDKPVNSQETRAKILASLPSTDYILQLPELSGHDAYDTVVLGIKPAIIATTKGDPGKTHKERQAEKTGAAVVEVIDRLTGLASSAYAENII